MTRPSGPWPGSGSAWPSPTPTPTTCPTPTGPSPTTASTPATTRPGPVATGRALARGTLSRGGARGAPGPFLGQGRPVPPLRPPLRHPPPPILRPPRRPAGHRRSGDPGGVLAGGDQLRVLVRRRPLRRAGVLRLHRPRAGRDGKWDHGPQG